MRFSRDPLFFKGGKAGVIILGKNAKTSTENIRIEWKKKGDSKVDLSLIERHILVARMDEPQGEGRWATHFFAIQLLVVERSFLVFRWRRL
ncbi:MAG TPA: hypothetical protein ENK02_10355 [Planctomycetes bacterium]|nr:hypothetical protein [Planctomycetota bacterium]